MAAFASHPWWPAPALRDAQPQTPPGPEGSNGSGTRVRRSQLVRVAASQREKRD